MQRLIHFIQRHPVLSYFTLAYTVAWTGIVLAAGGEGLRQGSITLEQGLLIWLAMLAGSGGVGLGLTALLAGRDGLRRLLAGIGHWRVGLRWYAPLLVVLLLSGATLWLLTQTSAAFTPYMVTESNKALVLGMFLVAGLGACIEEFGWTGFATPRLRSQFSLLATGLILGGLWASWHFMGDFTGSRASYGELFVPHFIAFWLAPLTAFRLLIVWVYEHTQSLLLAQLMHVSYTAVLFVMRPTSPSATQSLLYESVFTVALCVVVGAIVLVASRRPTRLPQPRAV